MKEKKNIFKLSVFTFLLLCLIAGIVYPQSITVNRERKDFKIHYRKPMEIFRMIQPYLDKVKNKPVVSTEFKTLSVSGTAEELKKIASLIQKYDTPLKQIWLEVILIQATGNGGNKPEYSKEIEPIVKKLKSLFRFGKYSVVGRTYAIGLEGSDLKFSSGNTGSSRYFFTGQAHLGYTDGFITLDNFNISVMGPTQSGLSTSVNIANGSTVILGASHGNLQEGALITVVTAKVVK